MHSDNETYDENDGFSVSFDNIIERIEANYNANPKNKVDIAITELEFDVFEEYASIVYHFISETCNGKWRLIAIGGCDNEYFATFHLSTSFKIRNFFNHLFGRNN